MHFIADANDDQAEIGVDQPAELNANGNFILHVVCLWFNVIHTMNGMKCNLILSVEASDNEVDAENVDEQPADVNANANENIGNLVWCVFCVAMRMELN